MGIYLENYRDAVRATSIELDDFQVRACASLEEGRDVLLCAPTGAGKTMVAHFAVELAFATSTTCVYTTPIKALSNQKYRELSSRYGAENIGLLTGDTSINTGAQILVMTTEVLRNLLYVGGLTDLGYVILDEVHYLADVERGPTWEEIILELDRDVRLISLSATVANAEEFHDWLSSVRGRTELVHTDVRPVPLLQQVLVGRKLVDLFEGGPSATLGKGTTPNPRLTAILRKARLPERITPAVRSSALTALQDRGLLPAIHFIFSRKMCDVAVRDLARERVSLTTREERKLIHQALDELREEMSEQDKAALHFRSFERSLANGYAAHHAGVYPAFKEVIERLMQRGLIKLVYATGTLALGINMPVRTTVLESLTKFNGTDFSEIGGIEYTQLIGRAGRRGKDDMGHAIVLASAEVEEGHLLDLGSGELEPLISAFYPSYNTVVNQLALRPYEEARAILARSFAQFQRNRDVAQLEVSRERVREALDAESAKLDGACEAGPVTEYVLARQRAGRASSSARKKAKKAYRKKVAASFANAHVGDVIAYAYGTSLEYAYVAQVSGDRLRVSTWMSDLVWLTLDDLRSELRVVGQYQLPNGMKLREHGSRDVLADHLTGLVDERVRIGLDDDLLESWDRGAVRETDDVVSHPVHDCPDREAHIEAATAFLTLTKQLAHLDQLRESYDDSVGAEFDATCRLLNHLGILTGGEGEYQLGPGATPLRRIHSTSDLLIYECLKDPAFTSLDAPTLAGMMSCFTFKERHRRVRPAVDARAWHTIEKNAMFLAELEESYGLDRPPQITPSASIAVASWAGGADLHRVLKDSHLLPGDFIVGVRRTIDLLHQVEFAMEGSELSDTARVACGLLARPGVVESQ